MITNSTPQRCAAVPLRLAVSARAYLASAVNTVTLHAALLPQPQPATFLGNRILSTSDTIVFKRPARRPFGSGPRAIESTPEKSFAYILFESLLSEDQCVLTIVRVVCPYNEFEAIWD